MLRLFAVITLCLTVADHWTTYLCLRSPVSGWQVAEANPLADWLFARAGLVTGLAIDSLITLSAIAVLMLTRQLPMPAKMAFFCALIAATGYAVVNNLYAIQEMGLSPLGLS